MENKSKDGWWETAIEIISSIWFSQMKPRSVEYIVRKLLNILKDNDFENIIERIKYSVEDETEDNVGVIAKIIFEILDEKELTFLREKVAKNEHFCDYVRDLVFKLSDANEREY